MASVRAIYILTSDNKILFSRKFPTIENRLQKKMGDEYVPMNYSDRVVCNAFNNQVIKEELIQEEFKCKTYKEDLEIDHQKMEELIKNIDININVNNFKNYSECPIVTLNIHNTKIWPCLYIKKFKMYGIVFPNLDFEKYKSIKNKLEKELEKENIKSDIKDINEKDCININLNNLVNQNETTNSNLNESNGNLCNFNLNENAENSKPILSNGNLLMDNQKENNLNNNYLEDSQSTFSKNRDYEDVESNNNFNLDINNSNLQDNNYNNGIIGQNLIQRQNSSLNNNQKNSNSYNPINSAHIPNNNYFHSTNSNLIESESYLNSSNKQDLKIITSNPNCFSTQAYNYTSNRNSGNLDSVNSSNYNQNQNLLQNTNVMLNNESITLKDNLNRQQIRQNNVGLNSISNINLDSNINQKQTSCENPFLQQINPNLHSYNLTESSLKKQEDSNSIFPQKDQKDNTNTTSREEEKLFKLKKLYEEQDISIVGCITLMENLLNYIIVSKSYEENKIHTLISNMVPFGNIIETNINFMLESLNFLNQRLFNSNALFSHSEKKSHVDQEKIKIPGWVTKIPTHYSENLNITIKEELKFVKHGKNKYYNIILCDISCLAELSRNCEITLPIKEAKTNYLGNLRIHPCAKLENQNILNDATRIIFIPPHDEFKMGVFEIENFDQEKLPIRAYFCLKESAQNEVKLYLKVIIDENIISKFEYFYINIPLGHFGIIIDTKIMVQVGEVSLVNNKTTLHWDLQNKVFDRVIVLSGTVNYLPRGKQGINKEEKKEKNSDKVNFNKIINN